MHDAVGIEIDDSMSNELSETFYTSVHVQNSCIWRKVVLGLLYSWLPDLLGKLFNDHLPTLTKKLSSTASTMFLLRDFKRYLLDYPQVSASSGFMSAILPYGDIPLNWSKE